MLSREAFERLAVEEPYLVFTLSKICMVRQLMLCHTHNATLQFYFISIKTTAGKSNNQYLLVLFAGLSGS